MVYKTPPQQVADFVEFPRKINNTDNKLIEDIKKTHEEVRAKISQANVKYKVTTNTNVRLKIF